MFEPRRILVPTDFTEDSDRALREAIDIASATSGKVYLLHVDERMPIVVGDAVLDPKVVAATEKSDELIARRKMVEEGFGWGKVVGLLRKLRHRGVERVDWVFTFTMAVYNLVRLRTLIRAGVCA